MSKILLYILSLFGIKWGTVKKNDRNQQVWDNHSIRIGSKFLKVSSLKESGQVYAKFEPMFLVAQGDPPDWMADSNKKGTFIGQIHGESVILKPWADAFLMNANRSHADYEPSVLRLHNPEKATLLGDVANTLKYVPQGEVKKETVEA